MLDIIRTTIEIGLPRPVKVLHITDSHIPLSDERDNETMRAIAAHKGPRQREFLANPDEEIAYGEANCDLIVHRR